MTEETQQQQQAYLSITNSRSSLKLTPIELVIPSSHLIFCRLLLLLPPIPPSIRVFSNESTLRMRWPKYQSFSFSIIPSKEHPGLISFRMDWLDLLAVQGTSRWTIRRIAESHFQNWNETKIEDGKTQASLDVFQTFQSLRWSYLIPNSNLKLLRMPELSRGNYSEAKQSNSFNNQN